MRRVRFQTRRWCAARLATCRAPATKSGSELAHLHNELLTRDTDVCSFEARAALRITLVVPGLLSLPAEALAHELALSRIASFATPAPESDLDAALLADLSLDAAPAPLAALGAGIDVANCWVIRADPVAMVVGREDARLGGYVHDLGEAERTMLLALLNAHFAADGLTFAAPRADAWFATSAAPHAVDTTSVELATGRALRNLLPAGRDAARWRRWLTEAQMLLHEHALASRAGRPVNALWFSGGGVLPDRARIPSIHARAGPGRSGDLLRGIARVHGDDAAIAAKFDEAIDDTNREVIVVALARVNGPDALAHASHDFLGPALDALERGKVSSVKLIADGERIAASWHAQRPSWLARLTRRRARFVPPPHATLE